MSQTGGIRLDALRKNFGPALAIDSINLDIAPGEFVSIIGPSGCGKSTLLMILAGFEHPSSGAALVDGRPIAGPGTERGVVFQEYALFPWLTVRQNLEFPLRLRKFSRAARQRAVAQYLALIGLEGFADYYPRALSGGMRQRVALARTLAADPAILLLDEPFGALDAQTRELMQDELLRIWRQTGKTIVLITHDVNEAVYLSQRVLVMSRRPGRIVGSFSITLDRDLPREACEVSDAFTAQRNRLWLAVRQQVVAP